MVMCSNMKVNSFICEKVFKCIIFSRGKLMYVFSIVNNSRVMFMFVRAHFMLFICPVALTLFQGEIWKGK